MAVLNLTDLSIVLLDWEFSSVTQNWKRIIVEDSYIANVKLGDCILVKPDHTILWPTHKSKLGYLKSVYEKFHDPSTISELENVEDVKKRVDGWVLKSSKLLMFL
jgi:hypothetical protein